MAGRWQACRHLTVTQGELPNLCEKFSVVQLPREDAIALAKSAAERTSSILDAFKGRTKADVPPDLLADIEQYARKLELVQNIMRKHILQTNIFRRILKRISNKDDIDKCKEILNESFQVFEVSLTLKLHTRLPDLLIQLQSYIEARVAHVQEYKGKRVVVKKYGPDKNKWVRAAADIDTWLESEAWEPHYLQIIGQSEDNSHCFHLVFQDPGVPVQNYIERECHRSVQKCTLDVLNMIIQFASASTELLRQDR
ncbi:hypothetical protein B0H10DRAFT_2183457, partial [Mycena sp. CBHHK59/15]